MLKNIRVGRVTGTTYILFFRTKFFRWKWGSKMVWPAIIGNKMRSTGNKMMTRPRYANQKIKFASPQSAWLNYTAKWDSIIYVIIIIMIWMFVFQKYLTNYSCWHGEHSLLGTWARVLLECKDTKNQARYHVWFLGGWLFREWRVAESRWTFSLRINKISLGFSIIFFHSTRKHIGVLSNFGESGSIWSHTVLCFQTSAGITPSPCVCGLSSRMICEEYWSDYHELSWKHYYSFKIDPSTYSISRFGLWNFFGFSVLFRPPLDTQPSLPPTFKFKAFFWLGGI